MNLFLLLVISHILGDVVFTSSRLARHKRSNKLFPQVIALVIHSGIHAFWAGLLIFIIKGPWLIGAFSVFSLHFIIDIIRCRVDMVWFGAGRLFMTRSEFVALVRGIHGDNEGVHEGRLRQWFLINVLDQGIHLAGLYLISKVI